MHVDPTRGTVGELMTREPIVVSIDTPASEVADLLDRFGISGLPIVDKHDHLVGVVSQTDLLRARATAELWARWPTLAAGHLMTQPAITASTEMPVEDAVSRMESNHVHPRDGGPRRPLTRDQCTGDSAAHLTLATRRLPIGAAVEANRPPRGGRASAGPSPAISRGG